MRKVCIIYQQTKRKDKSNLFDFHLAIVEYILAQKTIEQQIEYIFKILDIKSVNDIVTNSDNGKILSEEDKTVYWKSLSDKKKIAFVLNGEKYDDFLAHHCNTYYNDFLKEDVAKENWVFEYEYKAYPRTVLNKRFAELFKKYADKISHEDMLEILYLLDKKEYIIFY